MLAKDDARSYSEVREPPSINSRTYWQKIVNFQTSSRVPLNPHRQNVYATHTKILLIQTKGARPSPNGKTCSLTLYI